MEEAKKKRERGANYTPEEKTALADLVLQYKHTIEDKRTGGMFMAKKGDMGYNSHPNTGKQTKREEYLDWKEYFMATAFLAAKRSKDPSSQVGACVVDKHNKIVGVGYNGMPIGCSDDEFPWGKNTPSPLDSKYLYVCHAEMNAIVNKNTADVRDCTIYVGLFPCNECAKIIIQSGIKEVVYLSDKHAHKPETIASKRMFDATGVRYWQFKPKSEKIVIDFSDIDWNSVSPKK